MFAKSDARDQHLQVEDMEGKTVGYTVGYTYSQEVLQNKKFKLYGAVSDHNQLNMLANGRIQYALVYTMPGTLITNQDPKSKAKLKLLVALTTMSSG